MRWRGVSSGASTWIISKARFCFLRAWLITWTNRSSIMRRTLICSSVQNSRPFFSYKLSIFLLLLAEPDGQVIFLVNIEYNRGHVQAIDQFCLGHVEDEILKFLPDLLDLPVGALPPQLDLVLHHQAGFLAGHLDAVGDVSCKPLQFQVAVDGLIQGEGAELLALLGDVLGTVGVGQALAVLVQAGGGEFGVKGGVL